MTIFRHLTFGIFLTLGVSASALAESYNLIVQPFQSSADAKRIYTPLAKYLSETTGHNIELKTSPNFLAYWQSMKTGEYDLMLDAAHLTDYRAQKMQYRVLAKILDVVSLSLVTPEDSLVFEPAELVGKQIASLASPSRGAVILQEFFPNPLRQPVIAEVSNAQDAIDKVLSGAVSAAIIPTPLVGNHPQLNIVMTTEQWPHVALSASTKVPEIVANKIQQAITTASKSPKGQKMLAAINISGFEVSDSKRYDGFSKSLTNVWGY